MYFKRMRRHGAIDLSIWSINVCRLCQMFSVVKLSPSSIPLWGGFKHEFWGNKILWPIRASSLLFGTNSCSQGTGVPECWRVSQNIRGGFLGDMLAVHINYISIGVATTSHTFGSLKSLSFHLGFPWVSIIWQISSPSVSNKIKIQVATGMWSSFQSPDPFWSACFWTELISFLPFPHGSLQLQAIKETRKPLQASNLLTSSTLAFTGWCSYIAPPR